MFLHRTIKTPLLAVCLALTSTLACAQAQLPTDEQLAAWDARFLPGRYAVQEFDMDSKGLPIAKTVQTREQCLSAADMQSIARAPVFAALFWKCQPEPAQVQLDNKFQLVLYCGTKAKPVIGMSEVSIAADGKSMTSSSVQIELRGKKKDQQVVTMAKGSALAYMGECKATTKP